MPIDAESFRRALGGWASGVTIVTSHHAGERMGMTVSAFSSVSLDPPLILICADKGSRTNALIQKSGAFSVNVLAAHQHGLSNLFADKKREHLRFEGLACIEGATGCPRLPEVMAVLDCRVRQAVDAGDHWVYIADVEDVELSEREPLVYHRGAYKSFA